jgi:hypothetical protein
MFFAKWRQHHRAIDQIGDNRFGVRVKDERYERSENRAGASLTASSAGSIRAPHPRGMGRPSAAMLLLSWHFQQGSFPKTQFCESKTRTGS